jgi:hypothetical protein
MNISGALLSALIGGAGWILFAFAGQPIRRFWDLRGEVAYACNQYSRFISGPPSYAMKLRLSGSDNRDSATTEFRRLGMSLIAFDENERLATLVLSVFGFKSGASGRLLLDLAEALDNKMSLGPRRSDLLRFLRLLP